MRRVAIVLTLMVLVAALPAVELASAQSTGAPDYEYADAPCPSPNVEGVPQLELGPEFTCGYLTVPEVRAKPDGPKIKVAVARAEAASGDSSKPPLVWLEGGPGGTGLAAAPRVVAEGINKDRDVIFIDQRGTLHAEPLINCPEIDAFYTKAIGLAPTRRATKEQHVAATAECHDRWVAEGVELGAFNTKENAADVADLRLALGIDEWNVYGVSYGTYLALTLVRDHPEGVKSLVLDSVVPPNTNTISSFWRSAAEGYDAIFKACDAQPACGTAYPNLRREFFSTIRKLDRQPLELTVTGATGTPTTVVFDGYQLANLVVVLSFAVNPPNFTDLPAMIHGLATGDGTLAGQALAATEPPPGLTGYGLTFGVFCSESVAFVTPKGTLAAARRVLPEVPDRVLRLPPQFNQPFGDCRVWDVPKASARVHARAESVVPTLLLAGTFDQVTAPSNARIAVKGLPNGHIVEIPGVGHDVALWSECAREVMVNFLETPDGYDKSCVDALAVPAFATE